MLVLPQVLGRIPVKPSDFGIFIADLISVLIIDLFTFSESSWFGLEGNVYPEC